jgi:hypothetical protein
MVSGISLMEIGLIAYYNNNEHRVGENNKIKKLIGFPNIISSRGGNLGS